MQRGAFQLLTTAAQLLGEVLSALIAGASGVLVYRSVAASLKLQRAAAVPPFWRRRE
jgi:hypothetical protein